MELQRFCKEKKFNSTTSNLQGKLSRFLEQARLMVTRTFKTVSYKELLKEARRHAKILLTE
jgi:hypothetical protein